MCSKINFGLVAVVVRTRSPMTEQEEDRYKVASSIRSVAKKSIAHDIAE